MSNYVACYVAKLFGIFPLVGSRKTASLMYSLVLWICLGSSGIYMVLFYYKDTEKVSSKNSMLMKIIFIEKVLKFVVAATGTFISVKRSRGLLELRDKFARFDVHTLGTRCPSNAWAQTFYLLLVSLIGVHNFTWTMAYTRIAFYALFVWHLFCVLTMLTFVQYITYVRMVRERYKLANRIFTNSVIENSALGTTKYMYPKETNSLFIELRGLTEEVKTNYAYHAVLIIVESVLILVSSVTTLTVNYINALESQYIHNGYFIGQCLLRLMFLFFVVRETHETTLEANNTVSIVHEALSNTSDIDTTKQLEAILLNSWSHPVVFDVNDFFDLDYKLLQSIIASVVTYVVILVQIQLAIMDA